MPHLAVGEIARIGVVGGDEKLNTKQKLVLYQARL
jgi:hypothetical protein